MIYLIIIAWNLFGLFGAYCCSKFFIDGLSLFAVIVCILLGPISFIPAIVWKLSNIRIF